MAMNINININNLKNYINTSECSMQYIYDYADIKAINPITDLIDNLRLKLPLDNKNFYIELATILNELYNNSVDHGLLNLSSEIKQQPGGLDVYYNLRKDRLDNLSSGWIEFSFDYDRDKDLLIIQVKDSGKGFDFTQYKYHQNAASNNLLSTNLHGKGLFIVGSLSEQVEYSEHGTKITVYYRIKTETTANFDKFLSKSHY